MEKIIRNLKGNAVVVYNVKPNEFNYTLVFGYYTNKTYREKVVKEVDFNFKSDDEAIDLCETYLGHFGKEDKKHQRIFVKVVKKEPYSLIKVKYCDRDF